MSNLAVNPEVHRIWFCIICSDCTAYLARIQFQSVAKKKIKIFIHATHYIISTTAVLSW